MTPIPANNWWAVEKYNDENGDFYVPLRVVYFIDETTEQVACCQAIVIDADGGSYDAFPMSQFTNIFFSHHDYEGVVWTKEQWLQRQEIVGTIKEDPILLKESK
jgi:hypothetical protein